YALLPDTVAVGGTPVNVCTKMEAIFYGRKLASIGGGEQTTFTAYGNNSGFATLYYFAENDNDMSSDRTAHYWKFKPGTTTTVQVVNSYDISDVIAEYDFTQLIP
ncbi:MAG: hypothetical protein V3G53_04805, partial [Candidatus Enteromonas sp.]